MAGAECSHTSGTCLGCRTVADEREREAGGSSMLKWGKVSERLGSKPGNGRIQPDCVLHNGSHHRLERNRDLTSGIGERAAGRAEGGPPRSIPNPSSLNPAWAPNLRFAK